MTTSAKYACAAALLAGLTALPAVAAEPSLLERCWPASALAAREGERTPVKGAPGHAQPAPPLPRSTATATPAQLRGAIRRVTLPAGQKLVALTLDLCEQPGEIAGYDGAIIDYLRTRRLKATIFTGGKWFMTHAERSQQLIADPLFEMGSHGWAHRNVRALTGRALIEEVRGPEAAFQTQRANLAANQCVVTTPKAAAALQNHLSLYRFPFGACNADALGTIADNGMLAIQWDVSTGDSSKAETAETIARTLFTDVRPGSIVLAHANGRGHNTAEALRIAVPKLEAKGFKFVTVSELLAAGKPVITDTCYDHKPGDTDKYDALFQPRRKAPEAADAKPTPTLPR